MTGEMTPNIEDLIQQWMEKEREGVQFPVPLHDYWWIAGHKNKQDAFSLAESLLEAGFDFLGSTLKNKPGRGRGIKAMFLSMPGLEHLCLAAQTDQGKQVRELYRISKRNWDEVKKKHPELAQEIELERLKNEGRALEAQKDQAALALHQFRHYVSTVLPEPVQQKVLGYNTVEKIEYRDRIIHNDEIVNDGSTILKWQLCERYGFKTKNGKPDYKALNAALERVKLPSEAFSLSVRLQDTTELRKSWLPVLDRLIVDGERQRYIGE